MRQIDIGDPAERSDPGIVDQNIDAATAFGGEPDQVLDVAGHEHVGAMADDPVAADCIAQRGNGGLTNVGHDHGRTVGMKPAHSGFTNAGCAAGDDGNFSAEAFCTATHRAVYPPSTVKPDPLMNDDRSEISQQAASATSRG